MKTTMKFTCYALLVTVLSAFAMSGGAFAAGLPDGVIALSEGKLAQPEAERFCRQQGGRLPFVGDADFLEGYPTDQRVTVDGFAHIGAAWPEGLPDDFFWTGTQSNKDNPDLVYLISSIKGRVRADIFYEVNYREVTAFAACVPPTK